MDTFLDKTVFFVLRFDAKSRRSASSIEIDFYYRSVRCRERIKRKPTPANIKCAIKLKARIEHAVSTGEFDYRKHFPDSPRAKLFAKVAGDAVLLEDYLESWLVAERENIKHSTALGYRKILNSHLIPTVHTKNLVGFVNVELA